ncbi:DUF4386 domain-containing protein [Flavobacterium sp.]|uniref:DUF4386 domain-containing protein n=1 Tax=Flavobacterium sp. TaxID=239 RepID=UPI003D6B73F3
MIAQGNNISNKKNARIAGFLYLIVVLTGIFSLAYVPSKLIVWDNAEATIHNIMESETLFRLGIVSSLTCYVFFLLLPLALYRLLQQVDKNSALLMVILAITSVPISFINILNKFAVLSLLDGSHYLNAFTSEELQAQMMFYLNQYDSGILIVQVFWGLWLLPFGYLVFKSGFLPKFLGILLMLGCFSYLINFLGFSLLPEYGKLGISSYVRLPASLGEIGTCLWLLIMGAKERHIVTN